MSKKSSNKRPDWQSERKANRARKYEMQTMSAISFENTFAGIITGDAYDSTHIARATKAGVLSRRGRR